MFLGDHRFLQISGLEKDIPYEKNPDLYLYSAD